MRMFLRLQSKIIVFLLLGAFAFGAETAPVSVKVSLSKDKITIGDKVNFHLLAEGKGDVKFGPVDLSSYFGAFEVKDHIQKGPYKSWGKTKLEYDLVITTFTTGDYEIPEINISYTDKDGTEKSVSTAKLILRVEPVKPGPNDKDDVRDIKPPLTIPHSFWFWFFCVILFLVPVLGFFLYDLFYRRKAGNVLSQTESSRPAHELALERLEKLKGLQLVEQGKVREYYYFLSEIIRSYLEARFELPIVERTTSEAYAELRNSGKIKRAEITDIKAFLEECDLVKFARVVPESEKIENDYLTGVKIVETTKFVPPVPEITSAKGGAVK